MNYIHFRLKLSSTVVRLSRTRNYDLRGNEEEFASVAFLDFEGNQPKVTFNYKDRLKSMQILLSRTWAGLGRKVEQEQEEISRNHVRTF